MKVLIIDNYDSFTFNLYQYVGEILSDQFSGFSFQEQVNRLSGNQTDKPKTGKPNSENRKQRTDTKEQFSINVFRNDKITLKEIMRREYDRIILSPGPGNPADKRYFGVCADVLTVIGKKIPVLGVCLGMQGMAYYFGGKVVKAIKPMHGKISVISHDGKGVLMGLPQHIEVMRYHSLVAEKESLPDALEITSVSEDTNEVMGLRHKEYPIEGIQFHPESFATDGGKIILSNFLFNNNVIARRSPQATDAAIPSNEIASGSTSSPSQ